MHSQRYGDLRDLAAKTDGSCHLCHQPAPIELYGPTGTYGDDTVTIDHYVPQSEGGDDDALNLFIAHGVCNSIRGTRDVDGVRMALAGTTRTPMSSVAKAALSLGGGSVAAVGAGSLFGQARPDGSRDFNAPAAVVTGVLAALLLRCAL